MSINTFSIFLFQLCLFDRCSMVRNTVPRMEPVELLELSLLHGSFDSLHSVFLDGGFAFSVSIASCGTFPCFTSGPFKIWGSFVETVYNSVFGCASIVFDSVPSTGEPVELLKSSSSHTGFDGFSSVFNGHGFAWCIIVAPLSTLPGFTGSPFHVTTSDLEIWSKFLGGIITIILETIESTGDIMFNSVPSAGEPVEFLEFHGILDSGSTVFLDGSFAFSVSSASGGTMPGFSGSPFEIWGSFVDKVGSLVLNGVSSMGEPVEFLKIVNLHSNLFCFFN